MNSKAILLFLFSISAVPALRAQPHVVDSLERMISTMPDDTAKVNRLNLLVGKLQYTDRTKAIAAAMESIRLSKKVNYKLGLVVALRLRGVLYVDVAVLDSGKLYYDSSYALAKGNTGKPFRQQIGQLTHNYGVIFHYGQHYDSATTYYLKAATLFKAIGLDQFCYFPYMNLSSIYGLLKDNDKALEYAIEANHAAIKMNDPSKRVVAANQLMAARILLKQFDSIYVPARKNIALATKMQNYFGLGKAYGNMAGYFFAKEQYDSVIYYRKKALALMEQLQNTYEICGTLQDLGFAYKMNGDYKTALAYLKRATAMARENSLTHVLPYSLANLAETEEVLGNYKAAFAYLKEYIQISDSLEQITNQTAVNELEAKYQEASRELQIEQLESEKLSQDLAIRKKNNINYILAVVVAAVIIISLLSLRGYRQKQRLQQQRISELEKEKQLSATEAVLKGEEQERTRLAKDLHDGLGGMLSGIKYSFNTMKGNLIMTPENSLAFERSMDMLDSSIKEMRRVAHNMMPEALVKFGLDAALRDYCNDINQSGAVQVSYQSIDLADASPDQTTAITIYRVIQELINNTLKHSGAKKILVQVTKTNNQLAVTVEDDGKGFDTSILKQTKGIGWTNIQNRVDFLKGKVDVNSQQGKGTSVYIELNV